MIRGLHMKPAGLASVQVRRFCEVLGEAIAKKFSAQDSEGSRSWSREGFLFLGVPTPPDLCFERRSVRMSQSNNCICIYIYMYIYIDR